MKILHVLSDSNIGGAGIYLYYLLREMDYGIFDIHVVCPQGSLIVEKLKSTRAKLIESDELTPDKSLDLSSTIFLYKLVKSMKPDIVHTHASLSARIAAKLAGHSKIIFTKHCMDQTHRQGLMGKANRILNLATCDKIIAVSEAVKKSLVDGGIPERIITTIYNCIDLDLYKGPFEIDTIKRKYGVSTEKVVGMVARLEKVKGHEYFLEAIAKLKAKENVKYLIVGTGSRKEELKKLAQELGIADSVIFTGHVDPVSEVISIFDIMVLSSVSEAIGLVLLEGMASGKPCVAADTGGVSEIVRDGINGKLVPAQDAAELANQIELLLDDEELRTKMGEEGKKIVRENFDAKVMAQKVTELYLSI